MKPEAVRQAKERLAKVRQAGAALEGAIEDLHAFRGHWSDFLIAASAVYSKLEQGSKTTGRSPEWFGRKKRERKDDELLRYIHHARNADYHGIEDVTRGGWAVDIEYDRGSSFEIAGNTDNPHEFTLDSYTGKNPPKILAVEGPTPVLIPVKDSNVTYDPPSMHLGQTIVDRSPRSIAKLGTIYLENMIHEAEQLLPS